MRARPPQRPPEPAEHPLIAQAVGLHQAGQIAEAAVLYARILAEVPRHFDAAHLLGVIALQEGRYPEAERRIKAALQVAPNHAAALGNLGTVYLRMGRAEEAHRLFERTVRLQPDMAVPLGNLGAALRQMGRPDAALTPLRRAYALDPRSVEVCNLLGACLLDTGDAPAAVQMFEAVTVLDPGGADAWANLAAAVTRTGDGDAALALARKAVALQPGSSAAHAVLAGALFEKGQEEAAIRAWREAVALPAPSTRTLCAFGHALLSGGLCVEARQVLAQAIAADADNANARWALAMSWCEPMFTDVAAIEPARAAFDQALAELRAWFKATRRHEAYLAVGASQPFFLAYQPYDNRALLARYGSLCVEWMASMPDPGAGQARGSAKSAPGAAGRPLRVGFVSAQVRDHSVWNAITKGWVTHLDPARFEAHVFQLDGTSDGETEFARSHVSGFVAAPHSLPAWVLAIRAAQPDVLIYPEIGMDPLTVQLASLRLAPLQAAAWGHPETTGLPTMDLYLSAEDFEPADASAYYTEQLVRLPGLGVHVEPLAPEPLDIDVREFGLPRDEPLLLCPGAPFKYSPLQDAVWARIARGLHAGSGGWLVFFGSRSASMDAILEQRLRAAFAREGVDFDDHVCRIPALSRPRFFGLMQKAALMLDTIGFSGFNTALQAVECGLPVLAHEGRFMRGRLASAIMRRLGLPELVARDDEEFIARAVQLAADGALRAGFAQRIAAARDPLYRDLRPVRALEEALLKASTRAR